MLNIQFKMFCYCHYIIDTMNCGAGTRSFIKGGFFFFFLFSFYVHCFFCRPQDSSVSEDAEIEPRTVPTLALTSRRSNHSARSHQHSARSPPLVVPVVDTVTWQLACLLERTYFS